MITRPGTVDDRMLVQFTAVAVCTLHLTIYVGCTLPTQQALKVRGRSFTHACEHQTPHIDFLAPAFGWQRGAMLLLSMCPGTHKI
eukprot:1146993-Pelagomonas_calceolata.AAC.4